MNRIKICYSTCTRCGAIIPNNESCCNRCKKIDDAADLFLKEAYKKELKEKQMKANNQPRVWAKAKIQPERWFIENCSIETERNVSFFLKDDFSFSKKDYNQYYEKEIDIISIDSKMGINYYFNKNGMRFVEWMFVPGSFKLLIDEDQAQKMLREVNTDYSDNVGETLKDFIYKPKPKEKSKVEELKSFAIDRANSIITVTNKALEIIQRLEEENTKLKEGKQ